MIPLQHEIRYATKDDYEVILEMAISFFKETPYASVVPLDEVKLGEVVMHHLENSSSTVILGLSEGIPMGMLIANITEALFSRHKIASETAWWVRSDHRGNGLSTKLLDGYEYWAETQGADFITMASLNTNRADQILTNRGYSPTEVSYVKVRD